jgi:hypothetical protein
MNIYIVDIYHPGPGRYDEYYLSVAENEKEAIDKVIAKLGDRYTGRISAVLIEQNKLPCLLYET